MNPRFLLENEAALFSRSSNSEAFIAAANRCVIKMVRAWKEGARDSRYRSFISEKMLPHWPSLPGPLQCEGSMWAAGEESIHHVTHTAACSNPNGAGFLNLT